MSNNAKDTHSQIPFSRVRGKVGFPTGAPIFLSQRATKVNVGRFASRSGIPNNVATGGTTRTTCRAAVCRSMNPDRSLPTAENWLIFKLFCIFSLQVPARCLIHMSQATAFLLQAIHRHFRSLCLLYRDSCYGPADSFASFRLQYSEQ